MLHTKFRGNCSTGSRKEILQRVFDIYGHDGHIGLLTSIMLINFYFCEPKSQHTKFGINDPVISEKKTSFIFYM